MPDETGHCPGSKCPWSVLSGTCCVGNGASDSPLLSWAHGREVTHTLAYSGYVSRNQMHDHPSWQYILVLVYPFGVGYRV